MAVKALEHKFLDKFVEMAGNITFSKVMFAAQVDTLPFNVQERILDVFLEVIRRLADSYDKGLYNEFDMENYVLAKRLQDTVDAFY